MSFDNLGEASELERGTWDDRIPVGGDASVSVALPWLLDELDAQRERDLLTRARAAFGALGFAALTLHPFLMLDAVWRRGARRVLAWIAHLTRASRAWTGPECALLERATSTGWASALAEGEM